MKCLRVSNWYLRPVKTLASLLLIVVPTGVLRAQSYAPPALYGADALGRTMPDASDVRPFQPDWYVGIFYFLWLKLDQVHDNTKILQQYPEAGKTNTSPPWGPKRTYHFWGEPLYGYYRSEDPWVLRRHAALLSDAGVDFLIFDTTNAVIYENVVMALCKVFDEQRQLGEHVPQITFMVNTRAGRTAERIYELFYKTGLYPELWFRWRGKPLLLCDPAEAAPEVAAFFTLRKAHWPFELVNTHNAWHWEATYPQVYSYDDDPNRPEQVNVSVGQNLHQETGRVAMMSSGKARGRSFHQGRVDTRSHAYLYGFNFQEQWQRALGLDPEVVFITGWNEWIALQLNTKDEGPAVFCDQYDLEMSRDVEMMKGGYGDNYYMQMAANIRRYKGMAAVPPMWRGKTINVDGPFSQWDDVAPIYRDHALDTLPRDHAGCGEFHYRNQTGRNDLRILKVTHDGDNLAFYAQTAAEISPCTDPNWMWLLIGLRDSTAPDWEGFHFLVNRQVSRTHTSVEACAGGWNWTPVETIPYHVEGNHLHLSIPRAFLGIQGQSFTVEFKWIDNTQQPGNILDTYLHGDTAPEGRFRYRYEAGSRFDAGPER
jgi:hypothetical protein